MFITDMNAFKVQLLFLIKLLSHFRMIPLNTFLVFILKTRTLTCHVNLCFVTTNWFDINNCFISHGIFQEEWSLKRLCSRNVPIDTSWGGLYICSRLLCVYNASLP